MRLTYQARIGNEPIKMKRYNRKKALGVYLVLASILAISPLIGSAILLGLVVMVVSYFN